MHETWAQQCDKYVFVTKVTELQSNSTIEFINNNSLPVLQPAGLNEERYGKLAEKIFLTYIDLYYGYDEYDWYLKADDDTFIFVDNLKEFLHTKDHTNPVAYGYKISSPGYEFLAGGAGYVLSNSAFKILAKSLINNLRGCSNMSGLEDVDLSECLRNLKINIGDSTDIDGKERFHPFNLTTYLSKHFDASQYLNPRQKVILI